MKDETRAWLNYAAENLAVAELSLSHDHLNACLYNAQQAVEKYEMNVDIAPDGTIYGIELLNANAQLEAEDDGNLIVVNEALGRRRKLPLALREPAAKYSSKRKPRD